MEWEVKMVYCHSCKRIIKSLGWASHRASKIHQANVKNARLILDKKEVAIPPSVKTEGILANDL